MLLMSVINDIFLYLQNENQAVLRKHYSTVGHIFSLYAITEMFKNKKKNCFVAESVRLDVAYWILENTSKYVCKRKVFKSTAKYVR